ncbi:MAG TPA: GMC family oxidoreductase N-terminal domain-containing protein [Bryobacteraceae bacterium]|jgi:choline dehydrogenase|nr:GMC family oxidoreductase N-terminal domain-containing protein [Bryobacteraceae bacterium]
MMEADGGASLRDVRVRNSKRQSVFRSYVFPYVDRANLTVLSEALVTRVNFEGKRATGVEIYHRGKAKQICAGLEVVLFARRNQYTEGPDAPESATRLS